MIKINKWNDYRFEKDVKSVYKRVRKSQHYYDVPTAVRAALNDDFDFSPAGKIVPVSAVRRKKVFERFIDEWFNDDFMPF